jgi:prepilin-type N-terminal cleavage/methylation domain-containing protein
MRGRQGFTLIELLLVVAVILVIAAIAIPNLMRSRQAANESAAVADVRMIIDAQSTYSSQYPDVGFAGSLTALGPGAVPPTSAKAGILDTVLATGTKDGYTFQLAAGGGTPATTFTVTASPNGVAGRRSFCGDQTGTVRFNPSGGTCTTASPRL